MVNILPSFQRRLESINTNTLDSGLRQNDGDIFLHFYPLTVNISTMFRLLSLIFLFTASLANAAIDAQLDRDQISEGDTVALTLKATGDTSGDPDLSPLQQDFQIVGQSQSSSFSFNNFKQTSIREWRLQLMPKRSGEITIPPISIGNESSAAIELVIKKRDASVSSKEPIFIKASVDQDSAYIQQEVLITVQVYIAEPVDSMQLNDISFDNATLKKINQSQYQTTQNGVAYNVIEIRYSLFPREAGKLIIPEFVFSARQLRSSRSYYNMPGDGSMVRRLSQPITLNIKPIPPEFTGKVWLPARSLRLKEEWIDDPSMAQTGKAITRNVIIEANGLLAAQLPALPQTAATNLQTYPDKPVLADQESTNGIRSTREEPSALIATQPGTIDLPEIRIAWWDVDTNTQKEAILGSSQITAVGAALTAPAPVVTKPIPSAQQTNAEKPAATKPTDTNEIAAPMDSLFGGNNIIWQSLAIIGFIGWILTVYLWRKAANKNPAAATANVLDNNTQKQTQEKAAFKNLRETCRTNQPAAIRKQLLHWANSAWADNPPTTLDDIATRIATPEFTLLLQQLDAQMYRAQGDSSSFNSERLMALLDNWRQQRAMNKNDENPLPDLY